MNASHVFDGLMAVAEAERARIVALMRKLATKLEQDAEKASMRAIGEALEDSAGEVNQLADDLEGGDA